MENRDSQPGSSPEAPSESATPSRVKWRSRHRFLWVLSWGLGGMAALFLGLVSGIVLYLNTQQGQKFLASKIGEWTGHSVEVYGIHGSFPNHLRVESIKLNDSSSFSAPWLEIRQVRLDWSVLALLHKMVRIQNLSAKDLELNRLPVQSSQSDQGDSTGVNWGGYRIAALIKQVKVDRIHLAKEVTSVEMDLAAEGKINTSNFMSFFDLDGLQALPDLYLELKGHELNEMTRLQIQFFVRDHQVQKGRVVFGADPGSRGVIERVLKSDQLTPLSLNLAVKGPYDHIQTQLDFTAQKIHLKTDGFLDLVHSVMGLRMDGAAPAMTLNPLIHWDGWNLHAEIAGKFMAPTGKGAFDITNLVVGETVLNRLSLRFSGKDAVGAGESDREKSGGWARLHLMADGLRIPGNHPRLLASDPVMLDMVYHPGEKERSVDFHLQHRLVRGVGRICLKPAIHGGLDLVLPHLEELSALGGVNVGGESVLNLAFAFPEQPGKPVSIDLDGPVMITRGLPVAVNMIGMQGHLGLHAHIMQGDGPGILLDQVFISGRNVHVQGQGSFMKQQVKGVVSAKLDNLSALSPLLKGHGTVGLSVSGPLNDMAAQLELATQFQTQASKGYEIAPSSLNLKADLVHFPILSQIEVRLSGDLDHSPVSVFLKAGQKEKSRDYYVQLQKLNWRSLNGIASLDISGRNFMPIGNVNLSVTRLADFSKIIRQDLQGNLDLQIRNPVSSRTGVLVDLDSKVSMPSLRIDRLKVTGFIHDPVNRPDVNLKVQLLNLQLPQVKGNINLSAVGGMNGLKLVTEADFPSLMQGKGRVEAMLLLDLVRKTSVLQKMDVLVKGENIHLAAPAKVGFGDKLFVDHLRLSLAPVNAPVAIVDLAGTIRPVLAMNVSIRNITPVLATPFVSDLKAQGIANISGKLAGSLEKPTGVLQVDAENFRMLTGAAESLPPAQLVSQVKLMGTSAQLNTHIQMGNQLNGVIDGRVPLDQNGKMALNLNGNLDLGLGNAITGVFGQQIKGKVQVAMQVGGSYALPVVTGTVQLMNGSFRDFAQGISIHSIQARIVGARDHVTLQSFSAKAGHGEMNAEGNVGVFQPGFPVNLHFSMKNARPLSSDLLTAILDGDITISGMMKSRIDTKGIIRIKHAEINLPHSIASSVVPLKVIRPGEKENEKSVKSSMGPVIGLDLTIQSAGQILVQGFGLFTDMAGALHITGTADNPSIDGGMKMQNGHLDLSGISLEFTRGVIGFKGSNVDRKIDPSLDFEIRKSVEGNTVRLLITGFASAPRISLTSSPPLSQDRVLAMLLFGVDSQSLSATQMAEIGLALATLGGQSAGVDPLGTVRKSLGLDRLSLGGGNSSNEHGGSTTGTSVAAGKYIAKGVYVGAKQSTGNAGTQAEMQVDITKHLKATAAVGTGKDTTRFVTPDNDPGSNIGLLYQFDY